VKLLGLPRIEALAWADQQYLEVLLTPMAAFPASVVFKSFTLLATFPLFPCIE
jgi:hypothetical protein